MESTGKFEKLFFKLLKEMNIAGADGAFGDGPSMHTLLGPNAAAQNIGSGDTYAPGDARVPKVLGKGKVQTRKGTTGGKKRKKKKEKGVNFATGEENEEGVHEPVKPGILKKRLGELSCSKVRGAKGKLKDKGTHYAKALQRYLNYHCQK
jgi:hypothetical protein|tara:strand:- start:350 stop:799 length:450 start_codon:yes stop_codon:yes gene_type:complete